MIEPYWSSLRLTDDGFLNLPEQEGPPPLLESVIALWLKFHPHLTQIAFDSTGCQAPTPTAELRMGNMFDRITAILHDIDGMQDKARDKKKTKSVRRQLESQLKVSSLERQKEAFEGRGTCSDLAYSNEEASLVICKTLNSIRLIFPILTGIVKNPAQKGQDLVISKQTLRREDQVWLLGDYVYDIGTTKCIVSIRTRMQGILRSFIDDVTTQQLLEGEIPWTRVLSMLLESQQLSPDLPNPLAWLTEGYQEKEVLARAKRHDKVFMANLLRDKSSADLQEQFLRSVDNLKKTLTSIMRSRFGGARLDVYGSCLSDLSLGKSSDVDLSLHLPYLAIIKDDFHTGNASAVFYEQEKKHSVYAVARKLERTNGFRAIMPVAKARVPVVKGCFLHAKNPHTRDGSIKFDICFFNDIAVVNSRLLQDYTLVDTKAKLCMLAIKAWTRDHRINSAAEERISSYAWINLVIFYLQCVGFLPNLQCPNLMKKVGFVPNPEGNPLHFVNALDTAFVPWALVKERRAWIMPVELKNLPLSVLLYGFFHFYDNYFPKALYATSIRRGQISIPKPASCNAHLTFFCIEDPFETFNSHYPHDLGTPAKEKGREVIYNLIAANALFLRKVLCGKSDSFEGKLWESPSQTGKQSRKQEQVHAATVKGVADMKHTEKGGPVIAPQNVGNQSGSELETNEADDKVQNSDGDNSRKLPPTRRKHNNSNEPPDLCNLVRLQQAPTNSHIEETNTHQPEDNGHVMARQNTSVRSGMEWETLVIEIDQFGIELEANETDDKIQNSDGDNSRKLPPTRRKHNKTNELPDLSNLVRLQHVPTNSHNEETNTHQPEDSGYEMACQNTSIRPGKEWETLVTEIEAVHLGQEDETEKRHKYQSREAMDNIHQNKESAEMRKSKEPGTIVQPGKEWETLVTEIEAVHLGREDETEKRQTYQSREAMDKIRQKEESTETRKRKEPNIRKLPSGKEVNTSHFQPVIVSSRNRKNRNKKVVDGNNTLLKGQSDKYRQQQGRGIGKASKQRPSSPTRNAKPSTA